MQKERKRERESRRKHVHTPRRYTEIKEEKKRSRNILTNQHLKKQNISRISNISFKKIYQEEETRIFFPQCISICRIAIIIRNYDVNELQEAADSRPSGPEQACLYDRTVRYSRVSAVFFLFCALSMYACACMRVFFVSPSTTFTDVY